MRNKLLTLVAATAALWMMADGPANAQAVSGLATSAPECNFEYTLGFILAQMPTFACQEGDKVFQNFGMRGATNSVIPPVSNNFTNVPPETLVRFFDVQGSGVGIQFLVPPNANTAIFPGGGFPKGADIYAYNVAIASTAVPPDNQFTRSSILVSAMGDNARLASLTNTARIRNNIDNGTETLTAHGALTPQGSVGTEGGFFGAPITTGSGQFPTQLSIENQVNPDPPNNEFITSITNWWCETPTGTGCAGTERPEPPPVEPPVVGAPEPTSLSLFGLGVIGVWLAGRRRCSGETTAHLSETLLAGGHRVS